MTFRMDNDEQISCRHANKNIAVFVVIRPVVQELNRKRIAENRTSLLKSNTMLFSNNTVSPLNHANQKSLPRNGHSTCVYTPKEALELAEPPPEFRWHKAGIFLENPSDKANAFIACVQIYFLEGSIGVDQVHFCHVNPYQL